MTQPTDWVSSIVYSRKSSGQLRICLDPKDLNKAVKRPHYRTHTLDEVTHKLAGAKIFSKLDARHGYWSVSLDDESSLKTTFNSPFGRFCFTRLPFGLNLSQDVFQERMDNILEHCTGTMSIADDVGVFGKDEAEHDANLHNLMKTARRHGLVFNIDKCEIKRQSLKFFGLVFDAEGAHPDPKRIRDIEQMRRPVNSTELQEFLGIAMYMSPFLPKLSQQTAPLRDLLKKEARVRVDTLARCRVRRHESIDMPTCDIVLLQTGSRQCCTSRRFKSWTRRRTSTEWEANRIRFQDTERLRAAICEH